MSLMKTLAKVAIGVAVAKGASSMMNKNRKGGSGGLGGLLGGLSGGSTSQGARSQGASSGGGSLQDMLGGLMGGASGGRGGLGGLLNQLGGSGQSGDRSGAGSSGGLGGILGGLAGAAGAGGLLSGMAGGSHTQSQQRQQPEEADFGAVLNSQFESNPTPAIEPSQHQEEIAGLMIKAMIQAAKSDGVFDDAEREKLLTHLGDVTDEDAQFVQEQMNAPVDVEALVAQTPEGMGPQVYAVSLLAIDLDTRDEAEHLHKLAQGYGMTPAEVNEIHAEMGVPSLYT